MKNKKITQETFDATVKENIDEFGMEPSAALEDTVKQFCALGVDLSNIVTTLPTNSSATASTSPTQRAQHLVSSLRSTLEDTSSSLVFILSKYNEVIAECDVDLTNRMLLASVGVVPVITEACRHSSSEVSQNAFKVFAAITNGQPDIITSSEIAFLMEKLRSDVIMNDATSLIVLLSITQNGCFKHEGNRQEFVKLGLIELILKAAVKHKENLEVVKLALKTLRALTLDDDVRVPYGHGHEHAKMIVTDHGGIKILLSLATEGVSDPVTTTTLFMTLSSLAVRNEFCQEIVDECGLELILKVMLENVESKSVIQAGLGLLKAVAGNDVVKNEIVKAGGVGTVLNVVNKHQANVGVCLSGCGCLAALALRSPNNCQVIIEAGGAETIVTVIKVHKDEVAVQTIAYRAISNLVNRSKQYIETFVELGVEALINEARVKHKDLENQATSTLAVLGCKANLKELWTGEKGSITN